MKLKPKEKDKGKQAPKGDLKHAQTKDVAGIASGQMGMVVLDGGKKLKHGKTKDVKQAKTKDLVGTTGIELSQQMPCSIGVVPPSTR